MGAYRKIFYHIVFSTKYRESTIPILHEEKLYKYIWGIVENHSCKLYRVNGMPDHIHIFSDLHPSVSLSNFVKNIKVASSLWLKEQQEFSDFIGWQKGYAVFTYSERDKNMIVNYIKRQKKHHLDESSYEEYKRLLKENKIDFDEKYLL